MRRILIFSTAYFPFVGGAEVAVKEITDRITDWQFDMITARMDKKLPKFGRLGSINVYRVGYGLKTLDKFLLPFLGCRKAAELQKKESYAVLWSIMASQASIAASFFKKRNPGVKLLLTLQEGDEEKHLKRYVFGSNLLYKLFIRPWHSLVFKRADHISAISNYLKGRALARGVKCPIEIVPNGVDLGKFARGVILSEAKNPARMCETESRIQGGSFGLRPQDDMRGELGIKENEKVIITVSRLVDKNGVGDLIDGVSKLQTTNYKLLILGSGPLEKDLRFKTKNLKLEERVIFLGSVPNEKVPEYLAISDVFVRPSLSEGLGNSFLEAMAAGVPVVGTNVGGIPDFLAEGETGLFCEARNPKSIAEKIKTILENNALRDIIVVNAKKLVEEKYDWKIISGKMEQVFNKLF